MKIALLSLNGCLSFFCLLIVPVSPVLAAPQACQVSQSVAPLNPQAPALPADDSEEEEMGEVDEDQLIHEEENPDDDEGVTG